MKNTAPRSLFVVFNRIGDLTMSTPLFRALGERGELSLLTRPFGRPLLGGQPYVDQLHTLPYPNRGRTRAGDLLLGGHRRALGRELERQGFDEILIYDAERGVIKRWLNDVFHAKVREIPRREAPGRHASEIYRDAAAHMGCNMARYDATPSIDIDPRRRAEASELLRGLGERVVGVQMGSQRTMMWRLDAQPDLKALAAGQWVGLITRLIHEGHADAIAFHGAPNESRMLRRFLQGLPDDVRTRCHDLSGRVGLDLLPALLAEHEALISVDTGPAHIAAAVGCPLLVFFGPTDPGVFAPKGRGPVQVLTGDAPCQFCHTTPLYKKCRDNRCLNQLPNDALWTAWLALREQSLAMLSAAPKRPDLTVETTPNRSTS